MAKGGDGRKLKPTDNQGERVAAKQLRSVVERIERLEEEKRGLADDIKEIYKEAKGQGFDANVIRFIIRERRKDPDDVDEFETLVDIYKRALDTPGAEEEESF